MAVNPVRTASAAFPGANGKIAFSSNRDGNYQIYTTNPDGTGQTRLTNNAAEDDNPKSSPDGTKIAFSSNRDGNFQIYAMNADGSGQINLSKNGTARDTYPAWSPDGTKIVFERSGEIYVMNAADGSRQTRLTDNSAADTQPKWSPDGTKIAFVNDRGGTGGIYIMNADGSGQVKISGKGGYSDLYPDWSPDGKKIVFSSAGRGSPCCNLFTMNTDGSNITELNPGIQYNLFPSWSPDGSKIAFAGSYGGPQGTLRIYAMNSDGSGLKQLTINDSFNSGPDWGTHPLSSSPAHASLTVKSVDQFRNPLSGMFTVIRSAAADGTILKTGFTPLTFPGDVGSSYKVSVANYDGSTFSYWDDGGTSNSRTITLSSDTTVTAIYGTGDSLRSFTSLTYTGSARQPHLTVNATTLDGKALRMWTIIDPQPISASTGATTTIPSATYTVYATDGYQNLTFDHWGDNGSKDRVRTLTIDRDTTMTTYYKTG